MAMRLKKWLALSRGVPSHTRFKQTSEPAPGRQTGPEYVVRDVPADLPDASRWRNFRAIGITVNRPLRDRNRKIEGRYHLLSGKLTAKPFGKAVSIHWSIANSPQRHLDTTFSEDQCRVRQGNADINLSLIRRRSLTLMKNEQTASARVRTKHITAAPDRDCLTTVLLGA